MAVVGSHSMFPTGTEQMSELMVAAFGGDSDCCRLRLDDHGDDPNASSSSCRGFTPLMLAVLSSKNHSLSSDQSA
eukprot:m.479478 g.479478  ORF g.479478 m.479478 type:complete len:75 (-) comp49872_c0_seq1:317-541(-)